MQVYEASLGADRRPCPSKQCPQCGGCQKLQGHGSYWRFRGIENSQRVKVERYVCPQCGGTWGVIPMGMMPYVSMETGRFDELADEVAGQTCASAGGGPRPPPATAKEEGCIGRCMKRLSRRIPFLCGLLGQQMPLPGGGDIGRFWRALRELGTTAQILLRLGRDFKTSLFGCYRSLRAHWQREARPV